tara:strand:+ start:181 stop:348 length:168 start_codon:yes stop_codon:yes gene_type:complete
MKKYKVALEYIIVDDDSHNIEVLASSLSEACQFAEGIAEGWDSPAVWDAHYAEEI